jgi:hypothetical protein
MVLEFRYEALYITVSKVKVKESDAYCYSWITFMIPKETKYVQWIVSAELWYVMVILQPGMQVHRRLVPGGSSLSHSTKDSSTMLVLSKLSRGV